MCHFSIFGNNYTVWREKGRRRRVGEISFSRPLTRVVGAPCENPLYILRHFPIQSTLGFNVNVKESSQNSHIRKKVAKVAKHILSSQNVPT